MPGQATLWTLLRQLSWPELRHHAARHATAVLAVMLGVALAFSVQLINASALSEFASAVRSVNGEPDLSLRSGPGGLDEMLYARVAAHPQVTIASPVVEVETYALDAQGKRQPLRVLGLDALVAPALSPALLPRAAADAGGFALLDPGALFLNPAAQRAFGVEPGASLRIQSGLTLQPLRVAGGINAPGAPLAVMDIAGAQASFARLGRLSRIDLRLAAGADPARVLRELALPPEVRAAAPDESTQRLSNVSRAYRVNLTVLALVALFTGAFLVFSILSLSVAKRQPQFALLGVLGLGARERLRLVLAESALLGVAGSALGLLLGSGLALLALHWLGGDLGGGYFQGVAPTLQFSAGAALLYGGLGVLAAIAGGWLPARAAERLAPAQALKGLGDAGRAEEHPWLGLGLIVGGALLALAPPIAGLPLAAYVAVALLLIGGIVCVPAGVGLLLRLVRPPSSAPWLLAVERARRQRSSATVAVAGVVASLSLAVALTVMVASFRDAVSRWLDAVLPADLYVRTASGGKASGDVAWLPPEFVQAAARLPGVARSETLRATPLPLDPARPAPMLIARPLADPARTLPLTGELLAPAPGERSVYVSEAMVALYAAAPGTRLSLPLVRSDGSSATVSFFVRGVWRDYARQQGALVIADEDFRALTGDTRINDLALNLAPGSDMAALQQQLRALAPDPALIEFAQASDVRAASLRIFDRSFAVTYWLQAVAIAIGLFGIAASFSAQVLARRKEFGLLAHLGFTRRQVLAIVAGEGAAWTAAGALLGLALGLAVSVVLVHVVNPQSFHWTMELLLPWGRLAALCAAVVLAGTLTAAIAARQAASRDAVLAVKEDSVNPLRRGLLLAPLLAAWRRDLAARPVVRPGVPIVLPRDFGAHPEFRTEWWYVTGWLELPGIDMPYGFQVTFFRSRTEVPVDHPSRFAAQQLLFAHAALTDPLQRRLRHEQRIARAGFGIAEASTADTDVQLRGWRLARSGEVHRHVYAAAVDAASQGFAFDLRFAATQPVLLQGEAGYSRKGPEPAQASHYLSEPQLVVSGSLRVDGRPHSVSGRAWLDHEWSEALLHPEAVGWDWIGMNLDDGSALTAFRLRRADGSALWAGGSLRGAGGAVRAFAAGELRFTPLRRWLSPATRADYPVEWRIDSPAGSHFVRARLDAQELDSRGSSGAVYWEGLSDLFDAGGARVGRGYLEMTGYAARLRL